MDWYRTSIADGPTLRVFMGTLDEQVNQAIRDGTLPETAQIYTVTEAKVIRLYVTDSAKSALPIVGSLALQPCPPPSSADRLEPVILR
jgi:hypothetical protein